VALHVATDGTGDAVLLLHSSGFSGRQWKRLAAELVARGHRTVVPDLTGHGESPPWPEPMPFSFHDDVGEIVALLRGLGRTHLVAHSYGGLVALHAALAEPTTVRSLQLFDPVAFGVLDPVADRDARQPLLALDHTWDDPERWLRMFVDFWGGAGAWDALREPVRTEFRRVAWVVYAAVTSLVADTTPLATYRALACPVHIITGETSPLPARRVDERLVANLPDAHLDVIAGAGHLAPITQPEAVNRLMLDAITLTPHRG